MFQLVLADYSIEQIRDGFAQYLKRNSEMPAPADIVNIIDPPREPRPWDGLFGITNEKRRA